MDAPDAVIPERFDPELGRLDPGKRPPRRAVSRTLEYVNPRGQRFELTATANADHADALEAFLRAVKVWFEAVQPPLDDPERGTDNEPKLRADCLETFLEDLEAAQPDVACLAVEVALLEAEGLDDQKLVTVVGTIDPPISQGWCHGYKGPNYVSLVRQDGRVSLHGVKNGPLTLGNNVRDIWANNYCYVRGENVPNTNDDTSHYEIGARWTQNGRWRSPR